MNIALIPTIVYSSMMGMTILALVIAFNKPKQRQTLFLTGLLFLLLLHILGELHIYSGFYQYAPSLAGLNFPIRVLLGPALFFYACATMLPDYQPSWRSCLLALRGPVAVILVMVPFLFGLSAQEKLALADPATRNPEHWRIAVTTCLIAMIVFVVFTGSYLLAALKLHKNHKAQLMERFSTIEQRSLDWFRITLFLWGCAWLMFAVEYFMIFLKIRWFGTGIVLPVLEALILMTFAHLALKQSVLEESEKGIPQNAEPRSATLLQEQMNRIADKLEVSMSCDKLFLDEELSLKKLSEHLSVTENHISETLSQRLQTNFFHFVNGYRIEAAKHLLLTSDKLVSTIAYEVGFNSKSTFNAAFKRVVNATPSTFRVQ